MTQPRKNRLPPPVIEKHEGFLIVREDLVEGGSKRRVLASLLKNLKAKEFVYPSTAYGYGPLALAYAARDLGKKARLFYAKRNRENWTPMMKQAAALGAKIVSVPMGYMTVLEKRSRDYCDSHPDSCLLPLGFDSEDFIRSMADIARKLPVQPKEVWCAAGSGALTKALQQAWPDAVHHAVVVARKNADTGNAIRHLVKEPFEQAAKHLPPFPSASNYDAKVWAVMKKEAKPGALFWNVGA